MLNSKFLLDNYFGQPTDLFIKFYVMNASFDDKYRFGSHTY